MVLEPGDIESWIPSWVAELRAAAKRRGHRTRDVAGIIHLQEDSLRSRYRGDVPFRAQEFICLSRYYGLPLEPPTSGSDVLRFAPASRLTERFSTEAYLLRLGALAGWAAKADRPRLRVTTVDIPVLWMFSDPVLAAFKLFFFETAGNGHVAHAFDLKRVLDERAPQLTRAGELFALYCTVDSEEIWGREPLGTCLRQLSRLARVRAISESDTARVLASLRALTSRIETDVTTGTKGGAGSVALRQNRLYPTATTYLLDGAPPKRVLLTVEAPDHLSADDVATYDFFASLFVRSWRRARAIEVASDFDCRMFSGEMSRAIDRVERAIQSYRDADDMF